MLHTPPVTIILPGRSLKDTGHLVKKAQSAGHLLATVNRFPVLEKRLDIKFDIVYVSSPTRFEELQQDIFEFIHRISTKAFLTNSKIIEAYPAFFRQVDHLDYHKLCISDLAYEPGVWHNSLTALLLTLFLSKYNRICLLGCDGKIESEGEVYYAQEDIKVFEDFSMRKKTIERDTITMNNAFWGLFEETFGRDARQYFHVVNVNPDSAINIFPKMHPANFLNIQ